MLKGLSATLLLLLVGLVCTTYIALEVGGVVSVRTISAFNGTRTTHVWYVEDGGSIFLEASHPASSWVKDLSLFETIHIEDDVIGGRYTFSIDHSESAHAKIRRMMRQKYGWRDMWVSSLFDVSLSQLVELEKVPWPDKTMT